VENDSPCHGVLALDKVMEKLDKDQFAELKDLLLAERFSHGNNFERLHVPKNSELVCSIRLNRKSRLLLTKYELDGQCYWVLLDVLKNHEYHRAPALNGHLKDYFSPKRLDELRRCRDSQGLGLAKLSTSAPKIHVKAEESKAKESKAVKPTAVCHRELRFFNREFIVLDQEQEEVVKTKKPMLYWGMPGAGKTCVAIAHLTECLLDTPDEAPPLLYVTESKGLADKIKKDFLASPAGKSVPAGRVLFLSYDELVTREYPELKDRRVGKNEFIKWFNETDNAKINALKQWLGPQKAAELVYQELRMMSGLDRKQYETLCERESPLFNTYSFTESSDGKRAQDDDSRKEPQERAKAKRRSDIVDIHALYGEHLKKKGQYDGSFLKFASTSQFSDIVVDEAQDLSTLQLMNLHLLAVKEHGQPRIAYFADGNQCVTDNFPKLNFFKNVLHIKNIGELFGSFRCSDLVRKLADRFLSLKYFLTKGLMEKRTHAFIPPKLGASKGGAFLMPETLDKQSKQERERIETLIKNLQCVIITPQEWVADAEKRFPGALVLTAWQTKGLEYHSAVLYRMFDKPCYRQMNHLLDKYTPHAEGVPVHRAKSGQAHYEFNTALNELLIAATRSCENTYFLQNTDSITAIHSIANFVNALKDVTHKLSDVPQDDPLPDASEDDKIKKIQALVAEGYITKAREQAQTHLNMTGSEFERQFIGTNESKEGNMPLVSSSPPTDDVQPTQTAPVIPDAKKQALTRKAKKKSKKLLNLQLRIKRCSQSHPKENQPQPQS